MPGINRKVILGEHDKNIADILVYLLRAWEYEVLCLTDGLSLLEAVRKEHPAIILVDSNLPELDGLKVSKALKEDFLTAHIPVIILIDKKQIRKKMLEIEQGVDDYIVNPPDPIDLEVRMEMALRRIVHQLHANALTRLPGNREIERQIQTRLERGMPLAVAYYDIDNFKSFNDKYGYMKGDAVIKHTAYILSSTVKRLGNKNDFVGHVGGDDFVVVTSPEKDRLIASESILSFNRLAPFHYNKEDRERGYIVARDRRGNINNTPLMSLSIAIANNKEHRFDNIVQLMEVISEIKRYLKTLPGSNFLVNRRAPSKKKFVSDGLKDSKDGSVAVREVYRLKYKPLGQILLELNVIGPQELEMALSRHWSTGQKIGQSVINLGLASHGDIARALELQLNVPHFDLRNLDKNGELKSVINKIPADFIRQSQAVPVDKDRDVLSVAMLNPRDIVAIDRIKNATGCNVATFFVLESEFEDIIKQIIKRADKGA